MVRKIVLLGILLITLALPVRASDQIELERMQAELAAQAQVELPETDNGLLSGVLDLLQKGLFTITPKLKESCSLCAGVLAAVILCSLFGASESGQLAANLLGTVSVGGILLGPTTVMLRQGIETIQAVCDSGNLLLPVMSSAMVASGHPTAASGLYLGTALFNGILTSLLSGMLVPLLHIFIALSLAGSAIDSSTLEKLRDFIKTLLTWGLKGILSVFSAYMALTGVISGSADASVLKVTKMAISGVVPVVGSILADASETVLASAAAVRSGIGLLGLLSILAIAIVPFLELAAQYLLLKLTGALCAVVGSKPHSALVDGFGQAMGFILAMVGTESLLQMISIACFMKGWSA